jgi:two-component system, OmpR family, phosphate regulon sensor histidine kinase PhoR
MSAASGQLSASESHFAAALLHKLSQPLTALRGSLELALEFATTPEEFRQDIEEAMTQADRMVRLKRVLMELVGSQDLHAGAECAELFPVVLTAVEESVPVSERSDVRVETSCPDPLRAIVNVPRVAQALSLLFTTTLEYSPTGSTVKVCCERNGDEAVTTFSNAQGRIPNEELARLFDVFAPARACATTEDSGALMALARRTLEAAGGQVHAENLNAGGFVFVVRLPLALETSRTSAA